MQKLAFQRLAAGDSGGRQIDSPFSGARSVFLSVLQLPLPDCRTDFRRSVLQPTTGWSQFDFIWLWFGRGTVSGFQANRFSGPRIPLANSSTI